MTSKCVHKPYLFLGGDENILDTDIHLDDSTLSPLNSLGRVCVSSKYTNPIFLPVDMNLCTDTHRL